MDERFEDYRTRLSRVLAIELDAVEHRQLPAYPVARELRLPVAEVKLDILTFLSLYDCDLNRLAGVSSSSLGKVMPTSQRWLHELRIRSALSDCADKRREQGDREALEAIQAIAAIKDENAPAVRWNATWAGPEYQHMLSTRDGGAPLDFRVDQHADLRAALARQLHWLREGSALPAADLASVDAVNQQLIAAIQIGRLWVSMERARAELEHLNQALVALQTERRLCAQGRPTEAATRLRNVIQNVFAPRLQTPLTEWLRAHQQWYPLLLANLQEQKSAVKALGQAEHAEDWRRYSDKFFSPDTAGPAEALQQAMTAHAKALSGLLVSCGLPIQPGPPKP